MEALDAVRQRVLAACVLDELDVQPADDGVLLPGRSGIVASWRAVADACGPLDGPVDDAVVRRRLVRWVALHRVVADLGTEAADTLNEAARPLGVPTASRWHPGPQWTCEGVLGGALDLGTGVVGLLGDLDEVVPLPADVAAAAGAHPQLRWDAVRARMEAMGALAAARLERDAHSSRQSVLRPVGACDVVTLLGSRTLREALADGDGTGMRALAVPMRSRGWFDLMRVDPVFVGAAWTATEPQERAFDRPLLVTADEVRTASRAVDVRSVLEQDVAAR